MKKIILITFISFLFAACSNPFGDSKSNVDTNYGTGATNLPSQAGYDFVSYSQTNVSTDTRNHRVDITVGNSTSEIRLKTSQNKTVYVSVQGQMVSN